MASPVWETITDISPQNILVDFRLPTSEPYQPLHPPWRSFHSALEGSINARDRKRLEDGLAAVVEEAGGSYPLTLYALLVTARTAT